MRWSTNISLLGKERIYKRLAVVVLLSVLFFGGCHRKTTALNNAFNSSPPKLVPDKESYGDIGLDISVNNNLFAIDLYNQLKDKRGNLFFSPYSISSALAMTYLGARENTEAEMSEILHFSLNQNEFHEAFKNHREALLEKPEGIELNIANSIWVQKKYPFLDDYFGQVKKYYGSAFKYVDFENQSEQARLAINEWVADQTNNRILNLVPQGGVNSSTRMVLANAIYFFGVWEVPFNKDHTGKDIFYLQNDAEVFVKFMNLNREKFLYMENELLQAVEIPYAGGKYDMMILLPKEKNGLKKLEKYLTQSNLDHWADTMEETNINLSLPRFKFERSFELSEALKKMGIQEAFSEDADFSGMTGKKDLKIDKVLHKAFIEVNEKGAEAAASTAVIMMEKSAFIPTKRVHFNANHPFIFLIKERKTRTVLFLGRLVEPQ